MIIASVVLFFMLIVVLATGIQSGSEMVQDDKAQCQKLKDFEDDGLSIWELRRKTAQAMKADKRQRVIA